jgi:hypothetical protein
MICHSRGIQPDIPQLSANQHSGLKPPSYDTFNVCNLMLNIGVRMYRNSLFIHWTDRYMQEQGGAFS